jgi:hypothetical protein
LTILTMSPRAQSLIIISKVSYIVSLMTVTFGSSNIDQGKSIDCAGDGPT